VDYVCFDASVAAKWILPEQYSDRALDLYEVSYRASAIVAVPPHFPVEVTNIIRRRVVRGFLSYDEGREVLARFLQFAVRLLTPPRLYERAFELAEEHNLPAVYDAHYVAFAELLGCDLWTDDQRLLRNLGNKLSYVKSIGDYFATPH
jgi:predicted nucleic acid-binding protein